MAQIVSPATTKARMSPAARFLYVGLHEVHVIRIVSQRLTVLENRLGRIRVIDLREQPSPRADHRLEHCRISQFR